jgi:hypothetical protein
VHISIQKKRRNGFTGKKQFGSGGTRVSGEKSNGVLLSSGLNW